MDKYLRFENAIFCSSNCNFLRFSAHNVSLLLLYLLFYFSYCIVNKIPTPKVQRYVKV